MKVLILAGGFGTRLGEETSLMPKPMLNIGEKPIIWHIMKIYSSYGFNEFVILLGYKGYIIKEYFHNYFLHNSDLTIDIKNNHLTYHKSNSEPWKITLIDTGLNTMTGGRIKLAKKFINNKTFHLTYGDGLSDLNIKSLLSFHKSNGKKMTITAIQPEGRYGSLRFKDDKTVSGFKEKPKGDGSWINGGFFICEPEILDTIKGDETIFEQDPMVEIANSGNMAAYKHNGFWRCMDTLRDKNYLNSLWENDDAPWKLW